MRPTARRGSRSATGGGPTATRAPARAWRRRSPARSSGVRGGVGLLDASTLGKILVKGPDAGAFLDLLYTNVMSSLAVGRCRYGLMCNENGFLFDDGVVVRLGRGQLPLPHHLRRLGPGARLDGGVAADRVERPAGLHRQPDRAVRPGRRGRAAARARCWSAAAAWTSAARRCPSWPSPRARSRGIPARVYRISFSGELSYEVAVPAARGQELWDALLGGRRGASASSPTAPRRCTSCAPRRASS